MTYLEIVKRVVRAVGLSTDGFETLQGAPEEIQVIAQLVQEAEQSIVAEYRDWMFNRGIATIHLSPGSPFATPANSGWPEDLGSWLQHSAWRNANARDASRVPYIAYVDWRGRENSYTGTCGGHVAIMPDNTLAMTFSALPGDTLRMEYRRKLKPMTEDDHTSVIPDEFHQAIQGFAIMQFATTEQAPELFQLGQNTYKTHYDMLRADHLPEQFAVNSATNDAPTVTYVP